MRKALFFCLLLSYAGWSQSIDISLCTYNSLRYSPTNIDARHPHFRTIMNEVKPDVLVLQELSGASAAQMFLDSVLNIDSAVYSLASFIDGPDLDNALFYKHAKMVALPTQSYPTTLRDIFHFRLLPNHSSDTLHVFGVHLKASTGSTNESRRASEVAVLRTVTDAMPDSSLFLVCGDFNIYKSTEAAYQNLLIDNPGSDGNFVDQINITGTWNNAAYAQYHTQSPRTTQFNGGAHGGMDDRFDLILMSNALSGPNQISYLQGSMEVIGNDGQHYNKSIMDVPASAQYSVDLRTALHLASDHLPVVATFSYKPEFVGLAEPKLKKQVEIQYSQDGVAVHNPKGLPINVDVLSLDGKIISQQQSTGSVVLHGESGAFLVVVSQKDEILLSQKIIR